MIRKPRDQRGVAMVEFAFVLTFLMILTFGIVDYGYMLSDYQNVRQGVREAAREAASNPSQFVVPAAPLPLSAPCSTFSPHPATSAECFYDYIVARTGVSASQLTVSWGWQPSGTLIGGKTLFQVCVNYAPNSITGFAAPYLPTTLHSNVVMRMEPLSSSFPAPASPAATSLSPCT